MAAEDHLGRQFDYQTGHQPTFDDSPGAHEVDKIYPEYYDHPSWYHGHKHPQDPEAWTAHEETRGALFRVRGRPHADIDMYRAVPPGVTHINQGDWVTPSEQYARLHAMRTENPADDWPVLHARVKAHQMRAPGDYIPEFGYAGPSVRGRKL